MANAFKILTVTDIHQVTALYQELVTAVKAQKPDVLVLAGDFLDGSGTTAGQISIADCAKVLGRLPCRDVVFVRGNHEDFYWSEFAAAWVKSGRPLYALHGEAFVKGPLAMVGFPCGLGDETAFAAGRGELAETSVWLGGLNVKIGPAMRTLWLMHEPPVGTPLSEAEGPIAGNAAWNGMIERFAPLLTISGHDHRSPVANGCWHHKLGGTLCVNAGQSEAGPLHYCVVEAEFPEVKPCLPSRLKVIAQPWGETFDIV